jgi:hypothetical protein
MRRIDAHGTLTRRSLRFAKEPLLASAALPEELAFYAF